MSFCYERCIHFSDTDAAGVVFFARYYAICHEAYEESLAAHGLELARYFKGSGLLLPISSSRAEYKRPLTCGDRIRVALQPERLSENSFALHYEITRLGRPDKLAATVRTEHVCISTTAKERLALPEEIVSWIGKAHRETSRSA
jgi:1,4-dihydroxy-2-naphthoyl-CoA hydrolase